MPGLVKGNGQNPVLSSHGSGVGCLSPLMSATDECSSNVFVEGVGVVREGDKMAVHTHSGCTTTEAPPLVTFSSKVFVNGKGAARVGDNYEATDGPNIIQEGSSTVSGG